MTDKDLILESITAVGQYLSEKIDGSRKWNPESNKYSRAINPDIVLKLIAKHFTASDTFVVFTIIRMMNSENKIGFKALESIGLHRSTLWKIMKKLSDKGVVYEFPDKSVMLNPFIAVITKYRKQCLHLQSVWQMALKQPIIFEGEQE